MGKNPSAKQSIILAKLTTKSINRVARMCGYLKRQGGKISPKNLVLGFMIMVSNQRNTYLDWATEIGLLENKTIAKQSLYERMSPETECFINTILEEQLSEKIKPVQTKKIKGVLKNFKDVFIDDSTTLHLPDALAKIFPGNVSGGKKKALAKIHALHNLTQNNFPFLHIHNFSNNDQSLSANILPYLQKGDLCLRDLGFLVLDVLGDLIEQGVNCISRKNYQTKVYDIKTGAEIDLAKHLRKRKFFDKEVLIGKKEQLKVRLTALRMPDAQANERRRKARTDRDKRLNHSPVYYELLGYSIYLTNVSQEICDAETISHLYKLRWNIEIIFKSWKSCFSLEKIIHRQCTNVIRVKCIIYLMLLYICLFHIVWWRYCEKEIKNEESKIQLSILKMANFFRQHFIELITQKSDKNLIKQMKIHCAYDKRKDRDNAKQFQFKLAA